MATVPNVGAEAQRIVTAAISQMVAEAGAKATKRTAGQVKAMAEAMRLGIGTEIRLSIMEAAVADARRSMLTSYDRTRRGGGPAGYRQDANSPQNRRFSGGRLRRALADPRFFEVTADSVGFGRIRLLDDEAIQWARLNFGAAPAGQGSHSQWQVRWSNLVVASIGLNAPARAPFAIPSGGGRRGYWINGEFHPAGEGPVTTGAVDPGSVKWMRQRFTRGIQARNFIDAGMRRLVEGQAGTGAGSLPDRFRQMYVDMWRDATVRGEMQSAGIITVKPTRPPSIRVFKL